MIFLLLAVPAALASAQPAPGLAEAAHAIEAGRLDQARTMINAAVAQGAQGETLDRSLADLAFAEGNYATALPRYEALFVAHPSEARLAERTGLAALHLRQVAKAIFYLDKAIALPGASWRSWNARGIAADQSRDWPTADRAYARAAALGPKEGQVANNMGWSMLMRGEWQAAIEPLQRAASLSPKSKLIADNLELAQAAVAEDLPKRRPSESDESWAARLNDAGVAAQLRGDRKRAIAAFSQALSARSAWFDRAANNLSLAEAKQ
jgi:Flp pilus assembly protein TadD